MAKLVLVTIGGRKRRVSFTGSSLKELNEAIENEFADCIPNCCRNCHLQIFDKDFEEYVDLTDVSEVENKCKLSVVPHEDGVEEQESPVMVPYCTDSLGEDEAKASSDTNQAGAGAGALKTNIWTGKNVLYVKFLNSDILKQENWICSRAVLSIETILAWAAAWNTKMCPNIPIFENTDRADSADIRVKFEGGTCWSMVGSQAMTVQDISEPTMILSLKDLDHKMQKFLVMHEFGHALGLFHEHQRSDFWKVANSLLDVKKMKNDPRMKKMKFDRDILEKQPQDAMVMTPEYDPDSIMHYWFDKKWLKNTKHKSLSKVEADGSLSEDQKIVLRGVHKRHLSCADSPSHKDLDFLQEIYRGVSPSPTTSNSPGSASGQPPSLPAAPSHGRKTPGSGSGQPPSYERIQLSPSDKPYLNALYDAAYNGKTKWIGIGNYLNLSESDLDGIRINNQLDIGDRFRAMLQKWFQSSPNCYLDTFLSALRSEPVKLSNLCPKVEEAILTIASSEPVAKRPRM